MEEIIKEEVMEKIFEDEFMEIQTGMVSLCLEALDDIDKKVDKIYIYAYCDEHETFFNAFFKSDSKVLFFNDLGVSDDIINQVFDLGMDDTEKIEEICKKYNRKAPTQYKLIYDVNTKAFDSNYSYENLDDTELGCAGVFEDWKKEIKNSLL